MSHSEQTELYIGLMSGTSLDAMDAVLVDFTSGTPQLKGQVSLPYPDVLRKQLLKLCHAGNNEIDLMLAADLDVARISAQAVKNLLTQTNTDHQTITALGSHGQTIRHLPGIGNTLQIGSASHIAELTGITTVADFRRRDMAAGGEGAPLIPAFHDAVFRHSGKNRVIVNIGGMANITILPANKQATVLGFDTGPGNVLLDAWCSQNTGKSFDNNGDWAAEGILHHELLELCLAEAFFSRPPPKSTGRETFQPSWLQDKLSLLAETPPAQDTQRTLTELSAVSISNAIKTYAPETQEVYVCGGGCRNGFLMERLASNLAEISVQDTSALKLDPQWVEAAGFAWLARQTMNNLPGNLPAVTNASGLRVLGAIYPAS